MDVTVDAVLTIKLAGVTLERLTEVSNALAASGLMVESGVRPAAAASAAWVEEAAAAVVAAVAPRQLRLLTFLAASDGAVPIARLREEFAVGSEGAAPGGKLSGLNGPIRRHVDRLQRRGTIPPLVPYPITVVRDRNRNVVSMELIAEARQPFRAALAEHARAEKSAS